MKIPIPGLVAAFLIFAGLVQAADRPNFVIIFTDDQGYQAVSYTHLTLPTICSV